MDKPRKGDKKPSILELEKLNNQKIVIKYHGGRVVSGVLKGYDPLQNLVLDEAVEYLRDPSNPNKITKNTRSLGLIVSRGPSHLAIYPQDGTQEIANPFE